MADPITEPPERLTPINYAVDDYELEVMIELMRASGLSTMAAVMDLALYRLAGWYEIPLLPQTFDLAHRARRLREARHP